MKLNQKKGLLAYADEISRQPGEPIEFKVSSPTPGSFELNIVQIRCGDDGPGGPGLKQTPVNTSANGSYPARFQKTQVGSFARIPSSEMFSPRAFTLQAMIYPTAPHLGGQVIASHWCPVRKQGYALLVENLELAFKVSGADGVLHTLTSDLPLIASRWYLVAVSIDPDKEQLTLYQLIREKGLELENQSSVVSSDFGAPLSKLNTEFLIAGCAALDEDNDPLVSQVYNGKIDSVQLHNAALDLPSIEASILSPQQRTVIAAWDFSQKIEKDEVIDVSGNNHHGRTHNLPTRAVKGWRHDGTEMNWVHKPEHYGAIHFHDDDLYDSQWQTDVSWQVPVDFPSGVYAA
ncbi:MAG: N,N-dimethylformamidase beta subunit family domain-containing protein, partial [Pseudomonadota bacterium]|nr:N,N-dimethylformamidase beta subunit family domain-containing protein [Pseudomonadota bacterium]